MKLSNILLKEKFIKFNDKASELESTLRDSFNRDDIDVSMGQYHERDRGYGKVTIKVKEELPPAEYANMKNILQAKGFEVTGGANFADDDGDRYFYPDIKFEFDI